nr:hypothetical protein [Candidatus Collinsella stercoripullorum]
MDVPEGDPRDLPLGEALLEQVLVDAGEVPVRVGAERRPVDEAVAGGLHEQEIARRPVRVRLARVEHEADDRREVGLGGVARVADQRLAAPVLIPRVERRRRRYAVGAVDGDAALPRHAFLDERTQHRGVAALARVLGAGVVRTDQGGGGAVVAGGDAAQALPVVERADDRGDGGPVVGRLVTRVGGQQGGRAVEVGVVEVEPVVYDADRHRAEPVGVLPGAIGADGLRPPVVAGGVVLDAAAVAPAVGVGARIRLAQQRPLDERHDDALGGGELLRHGGQVGEGGVADMDLHEVDAPFEVAHDGPPDAVGQREALARADAGLEVGDEGVVGVQSVLVGVVGDVLLREQVGEPAVLPHGDPVGEGVGHPDHRGEGAESQRPRPDDRGERDAGAGAGADEEVESTAATAARHEIPLVYMMQLTRDHCRAGAGALPRANRRLAVQGEPAAEDGRAGAGEGWPRHGRPGGGPAELETDALHNLTMLKCPRFRR